MSQSPRAEVIWDKITMKDETFDELFKLSHRRKDNLVTPVILEYFTLENYGLREEDIVRVIEEKYRRGQ